MQNQTTIADVRFRITANLRDVEAQIDVLQNELGLAKKELSETKAELDALKAKKD